MSERRKSGIYCIANEISGKRYVGQAASIGDRWLTHRSHLELGRHHCRHLQAAWKKHGATAFTFSVLEYVPLDKALLAEREQFWMTQLMPLYNVAPSAGSSLGMKHPPRTDEFRKRQGDMRRGKSPSPEALERIRAYAKQRAIEKPWTPTPEHVEKLRAAATGRVHSKEEIEKRRQQVIGRKQPPQEIARRAASLTGQKRTPEQRARIAESLKGKRLGKKHSEETKAKIGAAHKGRRRPDVTLARKGVPRTPEATEAIRAGLILRWSARAAEIKAAILANPALSITKIAKSLGADRDTVSKYRKELLCQTPQPKDNAAAVSGSQIPLDI
jgi:group I intron endonuclease